MRQIFTETKNDLEICEPIPVGTSPMRSFCIVAHEILSYILRILQSKVDKKLKLKAFLGFHKLVHLARKYCLRNEA